MRAASCGHVGIGVTPPADLEPAMEETFGTKLKDKLVFLDVAVDPEEHVYPMAIRGGAMRDMLLSKTEST
jgi:acetolactate synthase-1/2/3 large subunit